MRIPGVGNSIAQDFWDMGFRSIHELVKKEPEKLYSDFCDLRGQKVDRCMLYVFRCAVYYASHPDPEPEKLKWWNWSDKKISSLSEK